MSLAIRAFREFTRDVPLALWLWSALCVALVVETMVIVLALRRGSDTSEGTAGRHGVKRGRTLLFLFTSGFVAIGFPLLARTSLVRSWARIQGSLALATGAERAAEYSTAMSALINTCSLVPILALLVELFACFGIGLALGDLWSMKQQVSPGEGRPPMPRRWDGGELAVVLVLFLLLSIGPVVIGGLRQTIAINRGFEALGHSPPAAKLHVMDTMLADAQAQLDSSSRWALAGTLLAMGIAFTLLCSRSRRWPPPSADQEMRAWQRTLLFVLACALAGVGLWAWSAPLKAEADMPFPLPASVPAVRLPKDLPPTADFVGPDEIDTGPLVEIRRQGTTVDGLSLGYDEMVRQLRSSTGWQLRDGETPIQVKADSLAIVMDPEAPMKQLDLVLTAAREARHLRAVFVSPRMETLDRPVLGRIEHQQPTAAVAWLTNTPKVALGANSPTSTMDTGDYAGYRDFVHELVKRRHAGQRVMVEPRHGGPMQ
jgi:hypothetical protein